MERKEEGTMGGKDHYSCWGQAPPASPMSATGNRCSFSEQEQMLWQGEALHIMLCFHQ